jgi:hypothetical protein
MPKVDIAIRHLVDMIGRGELRLPEMQRRYVWTATRVRDLLDSLYRGYPTGAILVWETDEGAPTRDLGVGQAPNAFATQKFLLDGQQRLTSLTAVLKGEPITVRRRKKPIEILFNLDHPDGPPSELTEIEDDQDTPVADPDEDETEESVDGESPNLQERFGKRAFVVASRQLIANPAWIKVSDVLKDNTSEFQLLKAKGVNPDDPRYEKFSTRLQRLRAIREYQYVMQVLERTLSYEEVAEIFVRVNSLGVKLRGSDLALAQVTARWKNSLILFENFAEKMEDETYFSLDVGLLVKAIVIFATGQSRFLTLSSISVDRMQKGWEEAQRGLEFAVNFLRANLSIEDESLLSSPFLILAIAAFGVAKNAQLDQEEEAALRRWVLIANARGHYSRGSTETILDQDLAIIMRRQSTGALLDGLKQQFGRLHVEPQDFAGRGTRSPLFSTTYLALKANGAKDWLSGLGLSLTHQGRLHYIEYHHIFPKSLLAKAGFEQYDINEIANMAFVSGKANRKMFNRPPAEYLPELMASQSEDALMAHAIPTDPALWELDRYHDFLDWRRERLADEVNALLETAPGAA